MKIALVTDTYHPQINGVVSSIDTLSKELKTEHEVYIFGPTEVGSTKSFSSIPFPLHPDYRIALVRPNNLVEAFRENDIEIVHVHTPISLGAAGLRAARKLNLPSIGTFHTLLTEYTHYISENLSPLLRKIGWKYLSWFYSYFDTVTVPSKPIKEVLERQGIEDVKVIPNSVDINRFSPKESVSDGNCVLFVGRVGKEKKLEVLIDAAVRLRKKHPKTKFRVVGKGPDKEYYEKLVEKRDLSENFVFEGYVSESELIKAYRGCDIFAMPSDTETQGLVVLEAMACGKPAVGANARGIKDVINHGEDGYLFEPGKSKSLSTYLSRLLENRELRLEMGKRARGEAKEFSAEKIGEKWIRLYSSLIN